MTKRFDNVADDGVEKALRRGYTVPEGAVNLAWAKAPALAPGNNVLVIDTSKAIAENSSLSAKRKRLAFANSLGLLEDEYGNQIWDEEYPIISDIFTIDEDERDQEDYDDEQILPFVHISRYFHIDFANIASGSLALFDSPSIKVVDKNGAPYRDSDGKDRFKIFIVAPSFTSVPTGSSQSAYRVYVFLDMEPETDELYLSYNKVELNPAGGIRNQEYSYQELINPRPYYKYVPEESDVIDHSNIRQKIYSSKPSNMKEQMLGLPQPNTHGWKYFVPRKALADPRLFQVFRWRLACEITKPTVTENATSAFSDVKPIIRVGVVTTTSGSGAVGTTRANFLFYQLNNSDYNFSNIRFVNPMQNSDYSWNDDQQKAATYWHVNLNTVSLQDLEKFDILVWAPSGGTVNVAPYLPKINHFTENVGGTFIYETSSVSSFTGIPGISAFSPSLATGMVNPAGSNHVIANTLRFVDETTPATPNGTYGTWREWPINVSQILNNYTDIGSILANADAYAGWTLDDDELDSPSGYEEIPNVKFQYISYQSAIFDNALEATLTANPLIRYATLVHRRTNAGGNVFVSSGCLFEDHLFEEGGNLATRSMMIQSFNDLPAEQQFDFRAMNSSFMMSGEMKLRINVMLYSTLNKPSPVETNELSQGKSQTTTVYTDWASSWVINPNNGVLTDKEKADYNFVLLPIRATDVEPTWQRVISDKTAKQLIQEKMKQLDPTGQNSLYNSFEGAKKRYFLISTNPLVEMKETGLIENDTTITAWSTAYSPPFQVPTHLGSYVVRDEMIAGTGTGEGKRTYPPKPYELQSAVSYINDSTVPGDITATIQINGTYKRVVTIPDRYATRQVMVHPGTAARTMDLQLNWRKDGYGIGRGFAPWWSPNERGYEQERYRHMLYMPKPMGIDVWSDANHALRPVSTFAYYGFYGTFREGDRGPVVQFVIQKILNQAIFFQMIPGPYLREDGVYGPATAWKVAELQNHAGAQWIDGVVDAETWAIMGALLVALPGVPTWNDAELWPKVQWALANGNLGNASDGNPSDPSHYERQSRALNSPPTISEGFLIRLGDVFDVFKVSVMPKSGGNDSKRLSLDWVDATRSRELPNYDFSTGNPGPISGVTGDEGAWLDVSFPTVATDRVIIRLTQRGAAGQNNGTNRDGNYRGSARAIGVRDIQVWAKKYTPGTPPRYNTETYLIPGSSYEENLTMSYNATLKFKAGVPVTINARSAIVEPPVPQGVNATSKVTQASWTISSLSITPASVDDSFDINWIESASQVAGAVNRDLSLNYQGFNTVYTAEVLVKGPYVGNNQNDFYTKNLAGTIDPYIRRVGWVAKDDGIKLICKADGTPYGFPTNLPTQATTNTHFARFTLNSYNTDQTVYYGFYDVIGKEWISNRAGDPEVTYYDYVRRGPQNIYLAVQTTYELDTGSAVPGTLDPIMRPFKWAMPVYGVTSGLKAKIQIENLAPDMGVTDLWPIPVRTGSFAKKLILRARSEGSLTNYLKDYQGKSVLAFYDIPEARSGSWSSLFGRPYVDVQGEVPIIIDDNQIKVRQYPILMYQAPTNAPSPADPWLPAFKVYTRDTLASGWVEIPFSDIQDYNASTGLITLSTNLPSNDPRLVKVDYTSERKVFDLRHDSTQKINLNPYVNNKPEWLQKPLYVYMIPYYVMDSNNVVIPESKVTSTLRVTTDNAIFNPAQAAYDPSAVLLGMIYISTAFNVDDLILLDTRKRGGGASTTYDDADLRKLQPEFDSYWDVQPTTATSYQSGGFAIIRLPAELAIDFTTEQIQEVIDRNITIGVRYKLQDLQGNDWK